MKCTDSSKVSYLHRLVGLPCAQVNTALLTQIKSMGSYKVRKLTLIHSGAVELIATV